jgi:hypothetical protein
MEENSSIQKMMNWRRWPYRNTAFLILSIVAFFYFADTSFIQNIIHKLGELGYLGAFISGVFFVFTFTVAPAAVIIFRLADVLNPVLVALFAGAGAVFGDYIIFKYFRDKVFEELKPIFAKITGPTIKKIFLTPYFAWLLPLAGIFIIGSPLPDEVGVGLIGASKMKGWQFLFISFLLNVAGILIVVTLARSF